MRGLLPPRVRRSTIPGGQYVSSFGFITLTMFIPIQCNHTKEGVVLRNVNPSLGLCDHFPGCGILNYRSDRDWSLRVCYFWGAL